MAKRALLTEEQPSGGGIGRPIGRGGKKRDNGAKCIAREHGESSLIAEDYRRLMAILSRPTDGILYRFQSRCAGDMTVCREICIRLARMMFLGRLMVRMICFSGGDQRKTKCKDEMWR
jgi:hypothetical protein